MTIAQAGEKIKAHLATALIVLLAALLVFGLVRLGELEGAVTPISISNIPPTTQQNNNVSSMTVPDGGAFVASKNGTKYYPMGCKSANRIKVENRVSFATEQLAQAAGYSRTSTCP